MTHWILILLVPVIVGFVTASIKSYIDRIFLVMLSVFFLKMPLPKAIVINLVVMLLSSSFFYARHEAKISGLSAATLWNLVPGSIVGAVFGRWLALSYPGALAAILGLYAAGVGLRLLLVKIGPPQEPAQPGGELNLITGTFGLLTGLISTGGKAFKVPLLVKALKVHPNQAYLLASVATMSATGAALLVQLIMAPGFFAGSTLAWAIYFFLAITVVAMIVERFWTTRLQMWVSYLISPLLLLAGIRLLSTYF